MITRISQEEGAWENKRAIVIYGDSQLVINFCNRRARPSVNELYSAMQEIQRLRKDITRPVFFRHVPREQNVVADWLTNKAREAKVSADFTTECNNSTPFSSKCKATNQEDEGHLVAPVTTRAMAKKRRIEDVE